MSGAGPITEVLGEQRPMMTGADVEPWPLGFDSRLGTWLHLTCARPGCDATLARIHVSRLGPRRFDEPAAVQFTPADLDRLIEAHRPACPTGELREPRPEPDFSDTFPPGAFG